MIDSPELAALWNRRDSIRIPDETDVPLTDRVRRLIDTAPFRRLASIPQLGLVSWVYPGATHTRFEHSLGVYRNALLFVDALRVDARFRQTLCGQELDRLIVAALLHDIGHWPFCHPIEDLSLDGVPHHEEFAAEWLHHPEVSQALAEDWGLTPDAIVRTLAGPYETAAERMAASVLSGPIDVDKLDYLFRDSLHAGVPYGRNFDRSRLIGGLCLDAAGARLALDAKAKTAAEMMVFARYVMFSEVYWHHAVRSATAMFQRAFYEVAQRRAAQSGCVDWSDWFRDDHAGFIGRLKQALSGTTAGSLADGLFGARRRLWKRLAQYSAFEGGETYSKLARRPYPWTVGCADRLATIIRRATGLELVAGDVLIDAPPVGLEVEFRVEIREAAQGRYRPLAEMSPVIHTLATRQFDDFVKRVRIFVSPAWIEPLRTRLGQDPSESLQVWIDEAIEEQNSVVSEHP